MSLEREISLRDLFWYVISKWKLIILCVVLCALLAGAFSYLRGTTVVVNAETGELINKGTQGGNFKSSLEESVIENDLRTLNAVLSYQKLYNTQLEYNSTAEIMQLDPLDTYCGYISYMIEVEDQNMLQPVVRAYEVALRSLSQKYGEVVSWGSATFSVVADALGANESLDPAEIKGALNVYAYGASEEICRGRIKEINKYLENECAELNGSLTANRLSAINENYRKEIGSDILAKQKANADSLNTYVNSIKTAQNNLSDFGKKFISQTNIETYKAYIDDLIGQRNAERPEGEQWLDEYAEEILQLESEKSDMESMGNTEIRTVHRVSKKYLLLGAALGLILGLILFVLRYMASSRIKAEENVEYLTQMPFLSFVRDDSKRKKFFIDAAIEKKRFKNLRYTKETDGLKAAAVKISRFARDNEASKIYVSGSFMGAREREITENLNRMLNDSGVELYSDGMTSRSGMAVEEASRAGFAVLMEKEWKSDYETVRDTVKEFRDAGVKVLGLIAAE